MLALKIVALVLAVIIIVLLGVLFFYNPAKAPEAPAPLPSGSVSSTAGASAPLVSPDGALAVATSSLMPGQLVQPPLRLEGTVTGGGWFFEATFPIRILDADGTVLGTTTARAEGDWMSTGTVPWSATLDFGQARGATGTIVFMNDNPSGDPANAKTFSVPVRFK